MRPRFAVMVFFSGAAGGTGKSTLASSLAILLSKALSADTAIIDLDGTGTSTRLLGVAPSGIGILNYIGGDVDDVSRIILKSSVAPMVHVVPPGLPPSPDSLIGIGIEELGARLDKFLYSLLEHTGSRVIIIDTPSNPPNWVVNTTLTRGQVINIVVENTAHGEYILGLIDFITRELAMGGKVINILLNKTVPGMDITDRVRGYARNGFVATIPMSPVAHYLVANLRLPVLYQAGGSLGDFQKALDRVANQLARQVELLLTGRVEYG